MTKQVLINEHEVRNSTLSYRDTDYRRPSYTNDQTKERHAISHGMFDLLCKTILIHQIRQHERTQEHEL